MVCELALLMLFFSDQNLWHDYHDSVKWSALSKEGKVILSDLEQYYVSNMCTGEHVNLGEFATWFHQIQHPELKEDEHEYYTEIFTRMSEQTVDLTAEFTQTLLTHLKSKAAKAAIQEHLDNDETWNPEVIEDIVSTFKSGSAVSDVRLEYKSCRAESIFQALDRTDGLMWPLTCLNNCIGGLIKGDFGLVAAYVETGKTSFMTTVAAHMGKQLKEGSILYFNNEGLEERVQSNIWAAALRIPKAKIDEDKLAYEERYTEAMNGDIERIKVFNCDGWKMSDIAFVARHYKPRLIIIDMIDKLESAHGKDDAEHRRLQVVYKDARALAAEICPVIGTSQCDASTTYVDKETHEEQFVRYIPMRSLHESKVGKQGEMDFIITIGKDASYPQTRYIHVPKNKLPGTGNQAWRYTKAEVQFIQELNMYSD